MIFLDPKSDLAFKKLFGTTAHKNILIDFLNTILERIEGEKIIDIVLNDPYNGQETPHLKLSIVDVRCTDQKNNQYIVELQANKQNDYAARAQYYSSLALSRQLAKKEAYKKLVPVIFVGILDFILFESKDYISHHYILNTKTQTHDLKHLEFHFIELDKFNKNLEELTTLLDKWIYFFKNAFMLNKIPEAFNEYPALKEAFTLLEQGNWSKKELEEYDAYLDYFRSSESKLESAYNDGEINKAKTIALNLLDILDSATIAQKTGLSIQEVEELKIAPKN